MKVLFLYPNDYLNIGIPQGIAYLSAYLKKEGHKIDLFDFTFIKEREITYEEDQHFLPTEYTLKDLVKNDPIRKIEKVFIEKIEEFQPDLIAMSAMSSSYDDGINLLEKTKGTFHCPVVVGGVHPTIDPKDALRPNIIDYACIGEGEETLKELCERLEKGESVNSIRNLVYRDETITDIHINPLRPFLDLETLPCPDWELFDKRHLFRPFMGKIYTGGFYVMSRGCPYQCAYCVNSILKKTQKECGIYFRRQSVKKTVKDLTYLKERFGATWFKFADDSIMSFDLSYLKELRDGIKPLGIKFGCSIRPETTTEEKVAVLKDMGCVAMSMGIESGNEDLRKYQLGRRMSNESIINASKIIEKYGIRLSTFNMVGLPEETRENVFETICLNRKIHSKSCNVYIIYPYPGTPIAEKYKTVYRDENGAFIDVSKAKDFELSAMTSEEVEGLRRTFNLYLILPKELWPIIEIAESDNETGNKILKALNQYVDNNLRKKI